jgi:hypothetical protein
MGTTKEQREYIRMLDNVMPEKDILASLKDNDDELKWYLKKKHNYLGYQMVCHLVRMVDKSMDFWLSLGEDFIDMEGVLLEMGVVHNQKTVAKYRNKIPWVAWTWISSTSGLTQWFIEKCIDKIEWNALNIQNTTLTEGFMRKHKDSLDWDDIATSQEMSDEFMEEFEDRLDAELLFGNAKIPNQRINNLIFKHNGRFGKRK